MTVFQDSAGGEWQIDEQGCAILIRAWAQAQAMLAAYSVRRNSGISNGTFNAALFRQAREDLFRQEYQRIMGHVRQDPDRAVHQLALRYRQTGELQHSYRARQQQVISQTMRTLDRREVVAGNVLTGLRLVRDVSGIIFMLCIPAAAASGSLGIGGALLTRLGGSIFQGISTWEDTYETAGHGRAATAGLLTATFTFTSSLLVLPESAGRLAQVVFWLHQTTSSVVNTAAVSMIAPGADSGSLTNPIREAVLSEFGGQLGERVLGDITNSLASAILPVVVGEAQLRGSTERPGVAGGGGRAMTVDRRSLVRRMQGAPSFRSPVLTANMRGVAAEGRSEAYRAQLAEQRRLREAQAGEAVLQSTPFYRAMASGNSEDLMSDAERYVRGNLLRRT